MSKPQWGSMREPDIDPAVDAIARKVMDAVDNLRTATIRLARLDVEQLFDGPTEVTEEFISIVAGMDTASPALKEYAERVASEELPAVHLDVDSRTTTNTHTTTDAHLAVTPDSDPASENG
ncbi:hypothetical protein [Nocardia carnea]|uniref:hypothetical protein n=1 Tax=Nocardia carnea TaxID=37328 RepID=UPI0024546507|nr:hypothetical protein [Nocardia carnea]